MLAGYEAAHLFAEPVLSGGGGSSRGIVSWYSAYDGPIVEVDAIDEIARKPIAQKLSARLDAVIPALRDPEIGQGMASWLNVAPPSGILSVGGEPVLVDWGFLPAGWTENPASRTAHFATTLGRFAPRLAPPPTAVPAIVTSAGRTEDNGDALGSGRSAADFRSTDTAHLASDGGTGASRIDYGDARRTNPRPPKGIAAPAHSARPWLTPLVACAIAAAVLLVLLIPGVLVYPGGGDQAERDRLEEQRLRSSNESLEARLNALQAQSHDRVCRPGDGVVPDPGAPPTSPPDKRSSADRPDNAGNKEATVFAEPPSTEPSAGPLRPAIPAPDFS
jgi:hypothetical protein